ncbi:Ubiquinone biosynthesis O-methyltransferase [uncultured archaeon]|nr:Ubiquinone biosynthesis O-methyltransferase [uncultured archaeon]
MLDGLTAPIREHVHLGRYRIVADWIKDEGKTVLDIGCGRPCPTMHEGAFLDTLGYGFGLDLKRYKINHPLTQGSMTALPYADNSFDAVVAMEVIEHVKDYPTALKEVKRVLRPGGVFVMTTPENTFIETAFWALWEKTAGEMWHGEHVTNLTQQQWKTELSKYFNIEEFRRYRRGLSQFYKLRKDNMAGAKN